MAEPVAILLVAASEHGKALLREGPCGARPPMVVLGGKGRDGPARWLPRDQVDWTTTNRKAPLFSQDFGQNHPAVTALVLSWEGENVPEGWDRLTRVAPKVDLPRLNFFPGGALACARAYERAGFGTVVCLGTDGKEMPDV